MNKENILITGANGQIGTVLSHKLIEIYGENNVLTTDIGHMEHIQGRFEKLDIMDVKHFQEIIETNNITQIYHLASLLSAKGEQEPMFTWNINLNGLLNVLELSRKNNIKKLFFPSSIAVFGDTTPKENTPQDVPLVPDTVYGIGKVTGELWCNYYYKKYGLDTRSVRFPGIIGYQSLPGGGTTDYAVDIFHKAVKHEKFICFLKEDTMMPMMYMDDAINATLKIMEAPQNEIKLRYSYNIGAFSFTPKELFLKIKKYYPDFEIEYSPDFRQQIADSWVKSIDDSKARNDWGWKPDYNLDQMVESMITHLQEYYQEEQIHK